MITQYVDRIDKERILALDDEALVRLLQIEYRLGALLDKLEEFRITVDISIGIVDVLTKALGGMPQDEEGYDYLADIFREVVTTGSDEECLRFLRLARDFCFAMEHSEGLSINDLNIGRGGYNKTWLIDQGRQSVVHVRAGVVEWLKIYCPVHKQWYAPDEHECVGTE